MTSGRIAKALMARSAKEGSAMLDGAVVGATAMFALVKMKSQCSWH